MIFVTFGFYNSKGALKFYKISYRLFLLFLFVAICSAKGYSQAAYNTIISGHVTDGVNHENLPFVSAILENTTVGTVTDEKGRFSLSTSKTAYKITFSFLGYEAVSRTIVPGKKQVINVELFPTSVQLGEVVVKPVKKKYSNKNNPAVEIIDKVIHNKDLNRKESLPSLSYDKYEKTVLSISNISKKFREQSVFKGFDFIFDNVDTTRAEGKNDLPMYMREKKSTCFYRKDPKAEKEIVTGEKTINFSEYADVKGFGADLNYLYQNIDIYDNEIFFLSNKFLSPVASTATLMYRYFITDTVMVNNIRCIKLFFEPRNPADFLFHGYLSVSDDSLHAIRNIDMSFNHDINIDWIKDVRIIQDFDEIAPDTWLLSKDEVYIDFGVTQNLPGLLGHRVVSYTDYSTKPLTDETFKGPFVSYEKGSYNKSDEFWDSARKPPLDGRESRIYEVIDSVKKVPEFKHKMDWIVLLTTNYFNFGKVEIGPDVTFFSYNPVEGARVRLGGRTTYEFNKKIYFQGYLAYGFKDQQYKYNLQASYSLSGTSIYKFPVSAIKFNYQYDTSIPGQELLYSSGDNIFFSVTRGVNDKLFYNRTYRVELLNEFENHFSYKLGFRYVRQAPGGTLYFRTEDNTTPALDIPHINISETYLNLRFAPREEFYQGKETRYQVHSKYPTFNANFTLGSKSIGNDYNYQKLQLGISKRFYLSIIGYTDVVAEAGKVFGKVPYPLMFIHNANQTYSYQSNAYNMMNFLEFVSDKYVALNIDHSFNGFFINKIPVLKRLKLREVMTLKALYGGVGSINDPKLQTDLLRFPANDDGTPLTYTLEKRPYIEASIGMSNIFRVLRVDLIKRFSYMNNPNTPSVGVRVQIKFDI
jgi:hypothetical protein